MLQEIQTYSILGVTMPQWVLYIIIAAFVMLIVGLVIYMYSRVQKQKKQVLQETVDALEIRKNKILASTIESLLAKIRTFEQTERVVKKYKAWGQSWQEIRNYLEKEESKEFILIDDLLEKNKFKVIPEHLEKLTQSVEQTEKRIENLEREINYFVKNEETVHKQFETVRDALKQVAQLFFANKTSLEPYTSELEQKINFMDSSLHDLLDKMDEEEKATVVGELNELNDDIMKTYTLIKELPNAIALNTKVLQPQMNALQKAYAEMVEQDFLFQGLNLDTRIEKLQEIIQDIQTLIDAFELQTIESKGVYVRKQIEEIHQILVNEKTAKSDVIHTLEHLNQKMNRLRFDKESFLEVWNKLIKRYEVSKDDIHKVDSFSAHVLSAETKMILFNNQFEKNQEAHVVLLSDLKIFDQHLNELQYSLSQLQKNLDTIKEDEIYIKAQYKQLKYMHHRSKRKISQLPVELLSDDYLQKNDEAVLALKEIDEHLQFEVLDVKKLTELIENAQHLSIRFYKDTNMLIKAAAFAEKAVIYSNRYRFDSDVRRHLAKAEYLYNQGEYTEALDISLSTLEAVEPGIYDMLLSAYESAVQKEA